MTPRDARTLVIVPTYNELDNLRPIVSRTLAAEPDVHLLVVDDNSPDGTGDLADGLAAGDDRVHVLHRPGKEGLGAAYLAGFDWALARDYEVVVEMDADGSHLPEQLHRLLAALDTADLVARVTVGARWQRAELASAARAALPRRQRLRAPRPADAPG